MKDDLSNKIKYNKLKSERFLTFKTIPDNDHCIKTLAVHFEAPQIRK